MKWTRLSCTSFRANAVRLQLHALAYNLANFLRTLALPGEIERWSLTTLREKVVKIGAKVIAHGRYLVFQMAEVAVPREDTLIGFRLEAWAKSPRARLVRHPRFYLFDTGVTNALTHRLTAASDPLARGRLFEQWVVLECLRLIDYLDLETRCYYWRTNQGAEVDLVFERHGRLALAVEIKAKRRIAGADLSGLRSFAQAHPTVPRLVVCEVPEEHALDATTILPWRRFFERFERWL